MSDSDIGQEIIILRARRGWTQQELAKELNTTQRTIAAWESGETVPRNTMKVKIAQLFQLPDNYFLTDRIDSNNEAKSVTEFKDYLHNNVPDLSESDTKKLVEAFKAVIENKK